MLEQAPLLTPTNSELKWLPEDKQKLIGAPPQSFSKPCAATFRFGTLNNHCMFVHGRNLFFINFLDSTKRLKVTQGKNVELTGCWLIMLMFEDGRPRPFSNSFSACRQFNKTSFFVTDAPSN